MLTFIERILVAELHVRNRELRVPTKTNPTGCIFFSKWSDCGLVVKLRRLYLKKGLIVHEFQRFAT
jgi:hypothetical protein